MTSRHSRISASIRAASSCGEDGVGSIICASSRSRTLGLVSVSRTSSLIRAMIAGGVPAGAISAFQASDSTSMPLSFSVGTSGRKCERRAVATARIFTPPLASCGVTAIAGRQAACTSPRITAVIACGEPP